MNRDLTQLAEFLTAVQNGDDFDGVGVHTIDQPVWRLDQLADLGATELRDDTTGLGELARLIETTRDAFDGARRRPMRRG